jgi:hypothetical protein
MLMILPLEHVSYSAITTYLSDRSEFHRRYFLGERNSTESPSTLIGHAVHKYAETYLLGHGAACAEEAGRWMIMNAVDVDWGKTGNVEDCLRKFQFCTSTFNDEGLRLVGSLKVLDLEKSFNRKHAGVKLPIRAIADAVVQDEDGRILIYDWKTSMRIDDELKPAFIIQAIMYKWAIWKTYGQIPYAMNFFFMRTSQPRDGSPAYGLKSFVYAEHDSEEAAVKALVKSVIKEISKKSTDFLPNVRNDLTGADSWKHYVEQYDLKRL